MKRLPVPGCCCREEATMRGHGVIQAMENNSLDALSGGMSCEVGQKVSMIMWTNRPVRQSLIW